MMQQGLLQQAPQGQPPQQQGMPQGAPQGMPQRPPQGGMPQGGMPQRPPQGGMPQGAPQQQGVQQQQGQPQQKKPRIGGRNYKKQPLNDKDKVQLQELSVKAALILHSPKSRDGVLSAVKRADNPVEGLSKTASAVIDHVEQQMGGLDDLVKLHGLNLVLTDLVGTAEAAQVVPQLSKEDKALTFSYAVQEYSKRKLDSGDVTQDELKQAAANATQTGIDKGQIDPNRMRGVKAEVDRPEPEAEAAQQNQNIHPRTTMMQRLEGRGLLND